MVTLRTPARGRKTAHRTHPLHVAMRDFETTLNGLPVTSKFTHKRSLGRRLTRPLAHLSKTQRTVALSVTVGAAFIALDALIAGIVMGRIRRHRARQENEAAAEAGRGEEVPDEIVVETVLEEFARSEVSQ